MSNIRILQPWPIFLSGKETVSGMENSKCKGSSRGKSQNDLENVRSIVAGALYVRDSMARNKVGEVSRD